MTDSRKLIPEKMQKMPPQSGEGFDFDFESSFADYYGKIKEAPQAKNCNIRIYFSPEIGQKGFIGGLHTFFIRIFFIRIMRVKLTQN